MTNNRGAIGKVSREMGVVEGLPEDTGAEQDQGEEAVREDRGRAALWVVNPSSLSEWRRLEVEKENERVKVVMEDTRG